MVKVTITHPNGVRESFVTGTNSAMVLASGAARIPGTIVSVEEARR